MPENPKTSGSLSLFEEIVQHLGQGRLDDHAQDRLDRIAARLPADLRGCGGLLWRAIILDEEDHRILQQGKPVLLRPSRFECWSRSPDAIRHILLTRAGQAADETHLDGRQRHAVLLRREVEDRDCAIDVEAYFRSFKDMPASSAWLNYGSREQEVILRVEGGCPGIDPSWVAESWQVDDPDLYSPRVGEMFFDGDGERRIEDLLGLNDCGCFEVISGDQIYPLVHEVTHFGLGGAPRPVEPSLSPSL